MPYVLELTAVEGPMIGGTPVKRGARPREPMYLKSYDVDGNDGFGDHAWTLDPQEARQFETFSDAAKCYLQQSHVRPWRPDGRANKPLTALTVAIVRVDPNNTNT